MSVNLADRLATESGENLALFPLIYNEMGMGDNAMGKRIEYKKGQVLGDYGIRFVREIPTKVNELRRAWVKCKCGKEFKAQISSIKNSNIKSCGCIRGKQQRTEYEKNQILGDYGVTFIKDVENDKFNQRQALFRCLCGKEFVARIQSVKEGNTKSCGCRNSMKICQECGTKFLGGPGALHCTVCATRLCECCGMRFQAGWKYDRGWAKCCSKECADKVRKGNPIYMHSKINEYININCHYCSTPIVVRNLKKHRERKFCSPACQGAYYAKKGTLRRSDNPKRWRYEQMFTPEYKIWHKRVLLRDGYTCRECFDKGVVDKHIDLIVHHIIPVYVDSTKIVDIDNGITLCVNCHRKTLTHEMEYADYYAGLLNLPAPEISKQLFKTINTPQVLRKIKLGYTYKQVAKHFGMSAQTLRTKLRETPLPPRVYRPAGCTFYTVLKLSMSGKNTRDVSKILGTTTVKIAAILKLWGNRIYQEKSRTMGLTGNVLRRTTHITTKKLAEYFGVSQATVLRRKLYYKVI